jgi:hypothetical protein
MQVWLKKRCKDAGFAALFDASIFSCRQNPYFCAAIFNGISPTNLLTIISFYD